MNREKRDRRRSAALGGFDPGTDIGTLESAAESLMRLRDVENAIRLFALALRLRAAAGVWEESDAVT